MIVVEKLDTVQDVYDITVENTHSFFGDSILVHNCAEISLRPNQFCNLTEINASDIGSEQDFIDRAKAASFIGTLQASYTDFHYLRPIWKRNTEKDALLGVSMTGIASMEVFKYDMKTVAEEVVKENRRVAKLIGIKPAARTTTVKPAGTSSLVLGTSSGIHAWHNDYYIRRIRLGKDEAIAQYLATAHPELIEEDVTNTRQCVVGIPQKAPSGAVLRTESPIDFLERVKLVSSDWVKPGHLDGKNTHNVSATISIKDEEWEEVVEWMWQNRDVYNGLSVLPYFGGSYAQAPFEDITEEQYMELSKNLDRITLSEVNESQDNTNLMGELACAGGHCEIV